MTGEWNISQPSLKGLYHLSDANDSSGNGKNLTNSGGLSFVKGKFGNCVQGNGTNTLTIADNMGVDGGNVTILVWVKVITEPSSGSFTVFSQASSGSDVIYYLNYSDSGGAKTLGFHRSKVGVADQSFNVSIPNMGTSKWHLVGMTYDGTNLKGYYDGGFKGQVAVSGNGSSPAGDSFTLLGGVDGAFNGYMDEAIITGAALSYKQVNDYFSWATGKRSFFI